MFLNRKDIKKITDILEQFPEVNAFELTQDSSSGIGSVTKMTVDAEVNGIEGEFVVEIAGVEDW